MIDLGKNLVLIEDYNDYATIEGYTYSNSDNYVPDLVLCIAYLDYEYFGNLGYYIIEIIYD